MDQLHLAIQLDALVPTPAPPTTSEPKPAWPATAAGTLSVGWVIAYSGVSGQQELYRGSLVLRVEDYSRGSIVSIRYMYALANVHLQLAKARLLHSLTNFEHEGWDMAPAIDAVQRNTLVDRHCVHTHLRWAVQVQYLSGAAVQMPSPGTYSAIVLSEIIRRRTPARYRAGAMAR